MAEPSSRFKDRIALITGGSRGIGRAIAVALASQGAPTVVNYLDDETGAERTVDDITTAGGQGVAVQADVRSADGAARLVSEAERLFGHPVHILVNNAGVIPNSAGWEAERSETLTDAFLTNAAAAVFCAQACVPGMRKAGWGRIVNISSIYGHHASPAVLSYSMSKAALDAVTKALAVDLGPAGITVNSVAPGNIDTAMTRRAGEDYISYIEQRTPVGRLGTVDEVTDAVLMLCDVPFISGATLYVDGALSLAS